MKQSIFAVAFLACFSCASLPTKDDIGDFSTTTTNGADALKVAVQSSNLIADRIDQQNQATAFVRGKTFAVHSIPPTAPRLSNEQIAIRLGVLDDLKNYAAALSKAADQGTVDELEAAAQALGDAAAAFATAVPGASLVVAPGAKLTSRALGYVLADRYVRQVLEVVQETDPTVQALVALLVEDLGRVPFRILGNAGEYALRRDEQLTLIRSDKRITKAELRQEYAMAKQEVDAQFALSNASADLVKVIKAIGDAHHALAVGTPDVSLAIKRFSALATDAGEVFKAANTEATK